MMGLLTSECIFLLTAFLFTIFMIAYAIHKVAQRQVPNREWFIHCLVLTDKCGVT